MFCLCTTSNPGIPNFTNKEMNDLINKGNKVMHCKICDLYCIDIIGSKKKVAHCEICNICIKGFDHHCPFTSKCIGENNLLVFHLFTVAASVAMCTSFTTVIYTLSSIIFQK